MRQGDIYLVEFPFTTLEKRKKRPALIISNEKFNTGENVIIVGIYSKNNRYSEPLSNNDLEEGGLQKESYVRFSNLLSFHKFFLLKKLGRIKEQAKIRLYNSLQKHLRP